MPAGFFFTNLPSISPLTGQAEVTGFLFTYEGKKCAFYFKYSIAKSQELELENTTKLYTNQQGWRCCSLQWFNRAGVPLCIPREQGDHRA